MRVEAFLCDAATVREGLLNILGAGVTRIWRESFPSIMNVDLAIMITLMPVEAKGPHRLRVVIQNEDGGPLAELDGEFGVGALPVHALKPGEPLATPMVLNLRQIPIPKEGVYSVELLIDSQLAKSLPFVAALPMNQATSA